MKIALVFLLFCSGLRAQIDKITVKKETSEKPKCTATLAGMPSGTISAAFLAITNQINVSSACDYKITSFVFYFRSTAI